MVETILAEQSHVVVTVTCNLAADSEPEAFTKVYQALTDAGAGGIHLLNQPGPQIVHVLPKGFGERRMTKHNFWHDQDWQNKTIRQIAQLTGQSYQVVLLWRRKLFGTFQTSFPASSGRGAKSRKVLSSVWNDVDWKQQDTVICKQLGVSRERVRQIRRKLGKEDATRIGMPTATPVHIIMAEKIRPHYDRIKHLSAREVALEFSCTVPNVLNALFHIDPNYKRIISKRVWDNANWQLPSTDLASVWKVKPVTVYNTRCCRKFPTARWRKGHIHNHPDWIEAMRLEQEKADKFFAQRQVNH